MSSSIKDARKFMSAARAAARVKPVVVVKAGRQAAGAKAAATHTGALAGSDAVYAAAFRRAGLLRVLDLGELFDAAETLGRVRHLDGNRLAILTNGGGIGVLAADRLADFNGTLAEITPSTRDALDRMLPPTWSRSNPVDIIGDADAARYEATLETLLAAPEIDAVLAINVQTAIAPAAAIAARVADVVRHLRARKPQPKPVFALWVGAEPKISATFNDANIPHFETETDAVRGFMQIVRHRDAIDALMQTPPSLPREIQPDTAAARRIVEGVCADGRRWLDPLEVVDLLRAYGIATVPTVLARTAEEAAVAAEKFLSAGQSVVAKILSRDIVHKSDVGGVRLNLTSTTAVRNAVAEIMASAKRLRPDASILGVTLQPMIVQPKARELIVGIADDPTFGPVIVFGSGGTAVEVINDKALALPPLDLKLARDLIAQTRVARLLRAYRDVPAVNEDALALTLVKIAQLAADLPQVRELDINPLLADENGLIALDARVAVASAEPKFKGSGHPRFAVRPYPTEWERHLTLDRRTAHLRATGAPGGRGPLSRIFRACISGGSAAAIFFADARIQPRLYRPIDADRLRAGDGLRGDRRGPARVARRRAPAFRCQLRVRRIRHPVALRPQGSGPGLEADGVDDRIRQERRSQADRGAGVAREYRHVAHVPGVGLPHRR